jgi:hypothetical protein
MSGTGLRIVMTMNPVSGKAIFKTVRPRDSCALAGKGQGESRILVRKSPFTVGAHKRYLSKPFSTVRSQDPSKYFKNEILQAVPHRYLPSPCSVPTYVLLVISEQEIPH